MWDDKGALIRKGQEELLDADSGYQPIVRVQSGFFNLAIEVNGDTTIGMIVSCSVQLKSFNNLLFTRNKKFMKKTRRSGHWNVLN